MARLKKTMTAYSKLILVIAASMLAAVPSPAQSGDKFNARLAPAPALGLRGGASAVAGIGSASASLSGRKLAVTGSFEKMASAATTAKLGLGLITGARGDFIFDLTITKAPQSDPPGTGGTIVGSFDLTPAQVDALKQGQLYIQINSEGAPNGHLLGWLLK